MSQDKYKGFSNDLDTLLGRGFHSAIAPTERDRPQSERLSDANKKARAATVSTKAASVHSR